MEPKYFLDSLLANRYLDTESIIFIDEPESALHQPKKILLPMASAADIATVPSELFAKLQMAFYQSPEDAVFKALGVE